MLYLETPNISSVVYQTGRIVSRLTGTRPRSVLDRLFPPEHIVYFNRDSLVRLAQKCGLEVVRCETRVLPANEIAVSPGLQIGLGGLQIVDWIQRKGILLCLVLRRFPS